MSKRELGMVKRQFSLSKPVFKWLLAEARRLGISASEFLRRALDEKRDREASK